MPFNAPNWSPLVPQDLRILVVGATGGLGRAVVRMLQNGKNCTIGAHGSTKLYQDKDSKLIPLQKTLENESDCVTLINDFCEKATGIDALICLNGAIHHSGHWIDMPAEAWERDIDVNLNHPFYLARAAMRCMRKQKSGGRIILNGTESALHGGSTKSFPYAVAKRGTECLVQGLAREGAPIGILVNGVRLGFIASGFHERWHGRSKEEMSERAELVPLSRGGHPDEAAALIVYLLSGWSGFITGQMIPLTGGDWL